MVDCNCKCASFTFISLWSIVALLVGVLVAISFRTLELNTAGLKFDNINYILEPNSIYLSGRHWLGLGNEFKVFPTDYQEINFSKNNNGLIYIETKDPIQLALEISIMYKIRIEFIQELYSRFPNEDYQFTIINIIKEAVLSTSSNYTLINFFENRTNVSDALMNQVNFAFRNVFVELTVFELKEIFLDEMLENSILSAQIARNLAIENIYNKKIKELEGEIEVYKSMVDNNITDYTDFYLNEANLSQKKSTNTNVMHLIGNHSEILKKFRQVDSNGLNFSQEELNTLLYYMNLEENLFFNNANN